MLNLIIALSFVCVSSCEMESKSVEDKVNDLKFELFTEENNQLKLMIFELEQQVQATKQDELIRSYIQFMQQMPGADQRQYQFLTETFGNNERLKLVIATETMLQFIRDTEFKGRDEFQVMSITYGTPRSWNQHLGVGRQGQPTEVYLKTKTGLKDPWFEVTYDAWTEKSGHTREIERVTVKTPLEEIFKYDEKQPQGTLGFRSKPHMYWALIKLFLYDMERNNLKFERGLCKPIIAQHVPDLMIRLEHEWFLFAPRV